MPLFVKKKDGSREVYLHTKVMGTIGFALSETGTYKENVAEALSEAVTSYISRQYGQKNHRGDIPSDEILAMVEAVLCETGNDQAALSLRNYAMNRQMQRQRLEVIRLWPFPNSDPHDNPADGPGPPAAAIPPGGPDISFVPFYTEPWNKSVIIANLKEKHHLSHSMARMIAGIVEGKILSLGLRRIMASVIRELVRNELWEISQIQELNGLMADPSPAIEELPPTPSESPRSHQTP